jgi:hypothetical protein
MRHQPFAACFVYGRNRTIDDDDTPPLLSQRKGSGQPRGPASNHADVAIRSHLDHHFRCDAAMENQRDKTSVTHDARPSASSHNTLPNQLA